MLAQRYLARQLQNQDAEYKLLDDSPATLRQLAELRRLIFLTPEPLVTPYQLRNVYPVAGQSEAKRAEALSFAAALATEQPSPAFRALKGVDPVYPPPGYSLHLLEDAPEVSVGRAAQAILQQIASRSGRALLLIKNGDLVALFELARELQPSADTVCLQLQGLDITLAVVGEVETLALPNVERLDTLPRKGEAGTGLIKQRSDGLSLQFAPAEPTVLTVPKLTDLPGTLAQLSQAVRRTRRRFFWFTK